MEVPKMALNDTKVLGAEAPAVESAEEVKAPAADAQAPQQEEVVENFNPEELGSLSDKWAYVAAITDDSVKDNNTIKDPKTGKEKDISTGKIIGYVLKALEDGLEYPQTKINSYYRDNMFRFEGNVEYKVAKKGEEVQLTVAEALGLAADPKLNGVISGGKVTVNAAYTIPKAGGDLNSNPEILPARGFLKPGKGGQSLKELELRTAITSDSKPNPQNPKFPIVTRKIVKGFERFAPAIAEKPRKASAASAGALEDTYKTTRNAKAAAFAAAFNARRG